MKLSPAPFLTPSPGGDALLSDGPYYLIEDNFTDTRAAGAVDGTVATPGPGARGGADPDDKLSAPGGVLVWAAHTSADANNSHIIYDAPITRAPGVTLHFRARYTSAAGQFHVTLDDSDTEQFAGSGQVQLRAQGPDTATRFICGDLNNTNIADAWPAQSVWAEYAFVLKAAGAQLWRWNGTAWAMAIERSDGTDATLYAKWTNYATTAAASAGELDFIRVTTRPPAGIPIPS